MTRKKILVADDDPAIVDAVQMILEDEGYEVQSTINGRNIIAMKEESPDLLLLDIWMSGVDGTDICRTLKQDAKTKDIPIIMISANKDGQILSKQAGADDFLAKPFELEELINKVKSYSKRRQIEL